MQRRTAGIYIVLFLLISSGAFTLVKTARQPTITIESPDKKLSNGGSFNVDGREYEVTQLGKGSQPTKVTWNENSANFSTSLENNTTKKINNTTFRLSIPNKSQPQVATYEEVQNVSNDMETVKQNGTTYVVVNDDERNMTLIPKKEFKRQQFDEPQTLQLREGVQFEFNNNSTTVQNITKESVTLTWTAPKTNIENLPDGGTVQMGPNNKTFVVHAKNDKVLLSTNVKSYQQQVKDITQFHERIAGLWGVSILSFLTSLLLSMLAYLPIRR